jgi:hypothetical protein
MYSLYEDNNNAEFARKKEKKRNKLGYYAGAGIGAAGLGAGLRYGSSAVRGKMRGSNMYPDMLPTPTSDLAAVRNRAGSAKDYVGSNWNKPLKVADDARSGVARTGRTAYNNLINAKMPTKLALGAAGLAALGGAGYGAYKAAKGRKKKRRSLGSLLGR